MLMFSYIYNQSHFFFKKEFVSFSKSLIYIQILNLSFKFKKFHFSSLKMINKIQTFIQITTKRSNYYKSRNF